MCLVVVEPSLEADGNEYDSIRVWEMKRIVNKCDSFLVLPGNSRAENSRLDG